MIFLSASIPIKVENIMAQLIFQQYEKPLWRLQKYVWILNFHFILEDIRLYLLLYIK